MHESLWFIAFVPIVAMWSFFSYNAPLEMKDTLGKLPEEARWDWIRPHIQRDAVIVVADNLDLVQAGQAIANNLTSEVQDWIRQSLLAKPNADQIAQWDKTPEKKFLILIVQPFVIIQNLRVSKMTGDLH